MAERKLVRAELHKGATVAQVIVGPAEYGVITAVVALVATKVQNDRAGAAQLYQLAAKVELASKGQGWAVCVDRHAGTIHIEAQHHTPAAVEAHVAALTSALKSAGWRAARSTSTASRCIDCGEEGERVGHQTCAYPGRVSEG